MVINLLMNATWRINEDLQVTFRLSLLSKRDSLVRLFLLFQKPMIVTGPLSMNLESEISHELSRGEVNGIGMQIVDVGEMGEFTHKWILLDDEESLFERALGCYSN